MSDWFKHPNALCESTAIGAGTRVWAFAHLLPGAVIGRDCNICDHVFIENDVVVGDRVTLKCGVQLWDGVTIEDDVFVGPNATFTNDPLPRSRKPPERFTPTVVQRGASIGANATLLCGVTIGANAVVGSGAVVTHSVPPNAIVVGNPAYIRGYVDTPTNAESVPVAPEGEAHALLAGGVTLHRLPEFFDVRGSLIVGEVGRQLPFEPRRFFVIYKVPSRHTRGEHAHRKVHQFLVCLQGECCVVVDDGFRRQEICLSSRHIGAHVPPMVWTTQYKFSRDALLLVLASEHYDPSDYIRDYEQFNSLVAHLSKEEE